MKKFKRWIALLVAVLMCASLCGCQMLDNMRANHAVWQEDGTILWNGATYRKLENKGSLAALQVSRDYSTLYVTEPDVPVLLSEGFGECFDICADGRLLESYNYEGENGYAVYCREDIYEETSAYLRGGITVDTYFYSYYDFDTADGATYFLTEEQKDTLHRILSTVIPVSLEEYDEDWLDSVTLSGCDANRLFCQDCVMWIAVTKSGYYIEKDDYMYAVPIGDNQTIEDILKPYIGAYGTEDDLPPGIVV